MTSFFLDKFTNGKLLSIVLKRKRKINVNTRVLSLSLEQDQDQEWVIVSCGRWLSGMLHCIILSANSDNVIRLGAEALLLCDSTATPTGAVQVERGMPRLIGGVIKVRGPSTAIITWGTSRETGLSK
jgi:hypothetical protein